MTGLARAVRTVVRRCLRSRPRRTFSWSSTSRCRTWGRRCAARPRRRRPTRCSPSCPRARTTASSHRRRSPRPSPPATCSSPRPRARSRTRRRASARPTTGRAARRCPPSRPTCWPGSWTSTSTSSAARSRAITDLLTDADEAHVTCPRGTDLRLDLTGRQGIADDGDLTAPGSFGNLPCGEGFVAPLSGEGTVATRSLASIGLVQGHPAHLTIEGGRLTKATGPEGERLYELLTGAGEQGTNLAELGVGTNDRARLTGNILEDEKILGTIHVAFGASAGIGGTVAVPIHLDVVVTDATLTIGDTTVLDAGRYVL